MMEFPITGKMVLSEYDRISIQLIIMMCKKYDEYYMKFSNITIMKD